MKKRLMMLTMLLLFSLTRQAVSDVVPNGSYRDSCTDIDYVSPVLSANCPVSAESYALLNTRLDISSCTADIANCHGSLVCGSC
jgi:hypothetical protein